MPGGRSGQGHQTDHLRWSQRAARCLVDIPFSSKRVVKYHKNSQFEVHSIDDHQCDGQLWTTDHRSDGMAVFRRETESVWSTNNGALDGRHLDCALWRQQSSRWFGPAHVRQHQNGAFHVFFVDFQRFYFCCWQYRYALDEELPWECHNVVLKLVDHAVLHLCDCSNGLGSGNLLYVFHSLMDASFCERLHCNHISNVSF